MEGETTDRDTKDGWREKGRLEGQRANRKIERTKIERTDRLIKDG